MFGGFINVKLKDIRSRIVSYYIEIEFTPHNLRAIDFRGQNRFTLIIRAGNKIAEGINNATSTPANDGVRILGKIRAIIGGVVASSRELIAR